MNYIDIVLLITIGFGFLIGLYKGLVKEIVSLLAIFIGIFISKFLSPYISDFLTNTFAFERQQAIIVSYIFVFVTVVIILLILTNLIDKILNAVSLGGLNKIFGGLFGGLKYALVLSVLINIADPLNDKFQFIEVDSKNESVLLSPVKSLAPELWSDLKNLKSDSNNEDVN